MVMSRSACSRVCRPRRASTPQPPLSQTAIPWFSSTSRSSRTSAGAITVRLGTRTQLLQSRQVVFESPIFNNPAVPHTQEEHFVYLLSPPIRLNAHELTVQCPRTAEPDRNLVVLGD